MSEAVQKRGIIGLLALLSTAVVAVGIAWACTPQAYVSGMNPSQGPTGTAGTVAGSQFVPAEEGGSVEIRWDSASGPVLSSVSAPGGAFRTTITIPDASVGMHSVVAVGRRSDGEVAGVGSIGFRVTAPPAPPVEREEAGGSGDRDTAPGGSQSSSAKGSRAAQAGSPVADSPGGLSSVAPDGPSAAAGTGFARSATSASPRAVFAGSVSPAESVRRGASQSAAVGDLWSGFAGESVFGPDASDPASAADGRSGPQFAIGIALLGLGLVALTAGFLVAAGRRRRAEV